MQTFLNSEGIVGLITKDSTVAIASGDASADYYLLRVLLNQPEILKRPVKDTWNARYLTGAEIIRGFFYDRVKKKIAIHHLIFITN